ncbi:hypothetical protein BH23GEM2_BH23GEM2_11880 [soil metagenome]
MDEVPAGYALQVAVPLAASLLLLATATAALLIGYARRHARAAPDPQSLTRGFLQWRAAALLLALVFLAANQLLVRGVGAGIWDAFSQFYPYFVLVADHARAGRFVTWDAWSNGGLPLLGDPQLGAFSPIVNTMGLIFGGTSLGFRAYWLLMWWAGGMGMLLLGRHLKAPPWGAYVVALGFLFCGVYMGNAEHLPWVAAYSFLPFIVWRFDVALQSARFLPAAEAGALWGLSGLAGYPGIVVITACFCALWAIGRVAGGYLNRTEPLDGHDLREGVTMRPWQALAALGLLAVVGTLILAPTYISFFHEGAGMNSRAEAMTRQRALENAFDPGAFVSLVSPYLPTLKLRHNVLWPASDVSMVNIYVGVITPVLALFAVARRPRRLWRWWLLAVAALSLAAAVGEALPLRGWLYDWFYPMRFFRHSAIFRLYFIFSLCILALIATRDLAGDLAGSDRGPRLRLLAAALLGAIIASLLVAPFFGSRWEAGFPRNGMLLGRAHFFAVWVAIVGVAVLAWRLPQRARLYPAAVLLIALATADALLTNTISIPTVVRIGAYREQWRALESAHSASLDLTARGLQRLESACASPPPEGRCRRNDQLVTKVPVLDANASERNEYQLATARHPVLRESATGTERIWFTTQVAFTPPGEHAFAAFEARARELGRVPLVVHEPSALLARRPAATVPDLHGGTTSTDAIGRLRAVERVSPTMIAYSPDELMLDVNVNANGWLLVTDRWARGWQVQVNRTRRTLYGGNFIFRAVPVTAGINRVHFTFHPFAFPWLVVMSWGVLFVVGVLSGRTALRPQSLPAEGMQGGSATSGSDGAN